MSRVRALTATTAPLLLLIGCGGAATPSPAQDGDALVVAWQSDIGSLNPVVSQASSDSDVFGNLIYPTADFSFDCGISYEPGVYDSWSFSDDGTVLTAKIRSGLKWSDGTLVTAHDVAATYELVRDPSVASPRLSHVEHVKEGWPKALDDGTVEFAFTHAYDQTTMLAHAALHLVPKHVFEGADRSTLRGHPRSLDPLVSGPWRLKLHEKGSRFVLEPNPDFTGPASQRPKLKRIVFEILPEYTTRLIKLTSGEVDLMEQINIEDADRIRKDHPDIRLTSRGLRFSDYIGWNTTNPLFADKEVRRALTLAMDIDGMMNKLLTDSSGKTWARRSVGTITPELCKVHNDDIIPFSFDQAEAKRILASRGWTDTDGDGVLDKGGKPFAFTLVTNAGNKRRADAAILIQAALKQVGVQANLEQRESNVFFESLRKRDYEAALSGWSAALFIDPSPIWKCDAPDAKQEFNFTAYCNPEVDALIAKGLTTLDPAEANPIWREVQAKIYEDQPYTFLWWQDAIVAVHSRFENTRIDVGGLLNDLEQWEVPPSKVKYRR